LDYIDGCTDIPLEMKGSFQIEACQMALGEVRSYLDEFIGLAKKNAMVPIASDPTEAEMQAVSDILKAGGDIEVGGEEITNPDKVMSDPETVIQDIEPKK
jgi:fructose-specific component phosphotransferase system IIB-like protein